MITAAAQSSRLGHIEPGGEEQVLLPPVHLLDRRQVTVDQRFQQCRIFNAIAKHALVAIKDLAAPEMLADDLELLRLHSGSQAGEPTDDLGDALIAGDSFRKEEPSGKRTVGNGPSREARVNLVDLLLIEALEVVGRQLREVGR